MIASFFYGNASKKERKNTSKNSTQREVIAIEIRGLLSWFLHKEYPQKLQSKHMGLKPDVSCEMF